MFPNVLLLLLVVWLVVSVLGVPVSEQSKRIITVILIVLIVLWFFGGYFPGMKGHALFRPCG